jgi:hypothetical protein
MKDMQDSEKLIGKLIKKRQQENKAFIKILNALENKAEHPGTPLKEEASPKTKSKTKVKAKSKSK